MSFPEWVPDAQGKWNFDGGLIEVHCRYWPSSYQQNGKCSASVEVMLADNTGATDGLPLMDAKIEAPTEAAVKAEVERWVLHKLALLAQLILLSSKVGLSLKSEEISL